MDTFILALGLNNDARLLKGGMRGPYGGVAGICTCAVTHTRFSRTES